MDGGKSVLSRDGRAEARIVDAAPVNTSTSLVIYLVFCVYTHYKAAQQLEIYDFGDGNGAALRLASDEVMAEDEIVRPPRDCMSRCGASGSPRPGEPPAYIRKFTGDFGQSFRY